MSEASEREDAGVGFWLFSVLAAVFLGWWLAVRTMALRVGQVATVGAQAIPPADPRAKRLLPLEVLRERADDYLTVKELERHLPLCGKMIRAEIASGRLPSRRMRGKVTVKGSDALAWLLAREEGGFNAKNA
jgi:hypothetical protein